ncbi:MAG: hypothetical protein SFU83_13055 [Meiothermus sp.]|nr:hypothetical protein [Meiothermus sp.]
MLTVPKNDVFAFAAATLWLPLLMVAAPWLLRRSVALPELVALLGMVCLSLSLVLLYNGARHLLERRLRPADLLWLAAYGAGAVLYLQLSRLLAA